VILGADDGLDALLVRQTRVLEQAEAELERKDARDSLVDERLVEQTGVHGLDGAVVEPRRGHDQIVAGLDRVGGGVHVVGLDLLLPYGTAHVVPVGDEGAVVLPCAAQLVGEQPLVERDRYAFDGLVAEHERAAALLGDAFERRQEPGFKLAVAQVRFGGVTAALGLGVSGEVLGAGEDRVLRQRLAGLGTALIALDHGGGHLTDEHGVLAEGLVHATPAGVARDAQHRGERPVHAGRGDFFGGGTAGRFDGLRVPAQRHAELGGEDRGAGPEGVAVDAVVADDEWDAETGLGVHGFDGARQVLGAGVQDGADVLVHDELVEVATAGVELHHLADLLFEGHAGEQVGDALGGGQVGVLVGQRFDCGFRCGRGHGCVRLSGFRAVTR